MYVCMYVWTVDGMGEEWRVEIKRKGRRKRKGKGLGLIRSC